MAKSDNSKRIAIKLAAQNAGKSIGMRVALICIAIFIASLFLKISGYDWNSVLKGIGRGISKDFGGTIKLMILLLMTSLACCIPMKMGFFNLGVDGQYYMGALFCVWFALRFPDMPRALGIPVLFLVGGIGGMIWGMIPAVMKVLWKADEVVSTLLLNFVAELLTEAAILGPMNAHDLVNSSAYVPESYWLTPFLSKANSGFFLAIALAIILMFVMTRTAFGYELKVSGENMDFASYGGIKSKQSIIKSMLVSGFIAGMAGTIMMCGILHRFANLFNSAGVGMTGIVVAILANNNPIGCIFSSFFFATLSNGMTNMQRITDIPAATSDIVKAIIVLTISATVTFPYLKKWVSRFGGKKKEESAETIEAVLSDDTAEEVSE